MLIFIRSRHLSFLKSTREATDTSWTYLSAVAKSVWQLLSGEGVAQYDQKYVAVTLHRQSLTAYIGEIVSWSKSHANWLSGSKVIGLGVFVSFWFVMATSYVLFHMCAKVTLGVTCESKTKHVLFPALLNSNLWVNLMGSAYRTLCFGRWFSLLYVVLCSCVVFPFQLLLFYCSYIYELGSYY